LGQIYIQETAASLPASIIPLPREGNILDMCAAPGGKTTQLADRCKLMGSQATIWANEPDGKRIIPLASNLTRTGMENVVTIQHDGGNFGNHAPEFFDSILLDAPCSGEGTGFKSDFGTKFWDIRKVESIAKVQQQLLISAFKACKVGGSILYSTCTSNPLENEVNVQLLLDKYGDKLELQEIKID
jgi:16S rRNA (cytosine1407-C5)-methyltransferase